MALYNTQIIAARLKEAKKARHLKTQDLATKSNVSASTITSLMVGRNKNPSIESLTRIAAALDVSLDYFVKE